MSLPQRKKSAGEIAKLRESFGLPGAPGGNPDPAPSEPEAPPPAVPPPAAEISAPAPPEPREPKVVRSLKRSERIPVLPIDGHGEILSIEKDSVIPAVHLDAAVPPRQVRSLRKSEQAPLPATSHEPAPDSNLPVHRHSDREINDLRRRAAFSQGPGSGPPPVLAAHFALVIPGYLFAIGGAVCFYFYDLPIIYTGVCVAAALLIAIFIFIRRPLSRHHSAFIAAMSLFVIVFGALHFFPNLQHGT